MDETEIDLRSIFGLLRRQVRLIAATAVVLVVAAATVTFSLTPLYTASTLVMVDPSRKSILDDSLQGLSSSADSARIDGEVELARSDNVLVKVVQQQQLISDPEFGVSIGPVARVLAFFGRPLPDLPAGEQALNETISKLRNALTVQRRGLTYLISVSVRSQSPQRAADLANAVAQAYIADQLASKVESTVASLAVIQARAEQARTEIANSESAYDDFIAQNIDAIATDSGRPDLAQMQRQIAALEAQRSRDTALAAAVQSAVFSNDIDSIVSSLQSDALGELERQRQQLQRDIASPANAPGAVDLRSELAELETQMLATARSEADALRNQLQQSQTQSTELRQNLRREVIETELSADTLSRIFELQQNAELARQQYQTVLSRIQDLEAQADLQLADSRVVSPALVPQDPSFPNKALILSLSLLAALGLGVALAFLYENLIGGFTSDDQLTSVLKIPVASSIPRQTGKSDAHSYADLITSHPLSIFSESVRRTRTSIDQALRKSAASSVGRVLMVTSSSPGEGKTTLSLALARSYALSGQSVLLIDCDLRKPSLHKHLNTETELGLLEALSGEDGGVKKFAQSITQDSQTPLSVILGTRHSSMPTDQLLDSPAFIRLMTAARNTFDVILLDTPPLGPVVDGLYLARQADAILFVVKWASTAQREARRALEQLMEAKRPDVPVVAALAQQDESRSGYYRRYGDYYSYSA